MLNGCLVNNRYVSRYVDEICKLEDDVEIRFGKAKSEDFYNLLNIKTNKGSHTEATCWSKSLSLN